MIYKLARCPKSFVWFLCFLVVFAAGVQLWAFDLCLCRDSALNSVEIPTESCCADSPKKTDFCCQSVEKDENLNCCSKERESSPVRVLTGTAHVSCENCLSFQIDGFDVDAAVIERPNSSSKQITQASFHVPPFSAETTHPLTRFICTSSKQEPPWLRSHQTVVLRN